MGQRTRTNDAAVKDAQVLLKREECALSMGQRLNDAASKDVQLLLRREYARDTVHAAIPLMNLQLSHRALDQILIRLLRLLISVILQARSAYLKKL